MPIVSSYALSGARFPGSIQLQSVQRRVGEAIFLRSWQTPGLALGYFVVQLFTSGCVPQWLDWLDQNLKWPLAPGLSANRKKSIELQLQGVISAGHGALSLPSDDQNLQDGWNTNN